MSDEANPNDEPNEDDPGPGGEQPPGDELDEETQNLVDEVDELVDDDLDRKHEDDDDHGGAVSGPPQATAEASRSPDNDDGATVWGADDDGEDDPEEDEDEAEPPYWQQVGGVLAMPIVFFFGSLWNVVKGLSFTILGRMPKRLSIFQGLIKFGYNGLYRKTSGQFIVNCIYGDGAVVPWPAEYDQSELKVRTSNGEEWTAVQGVDLNRFGDTPIAWGVADDHEIVRPVQARIAEAVDAGGHRVQAIRWNDSAQPERVQVDMGAGATQQRAVSDGGAVTVEELFPTFDDVLVNVKNPLFDSDGWLVSLEKAYELHWSQAGTEEMQKQEDRGRLAELNPDRHKKMLLYILIAALGGTALGLFGPALAARIAGEAASGGSALPLFTGLFAGLL